MKSIQQEIIETQKWFDSPRYAGILRLYTARQVVEQRGTIDNDYTVAREAAAAFYDRLRQLFSEGKSITTFGPYSPGQAVAMKKMGIEGIYLGGWATSAKGGTSEDPGPDLASYPLSQVPDEAASLIRALLTADRNQQYLRSRMTESQRSSTPEHDFRRLSLPMPTPDTVATRTFATWSGASSKPACPDITSKISGREQRSADIRVEKSWSPRMSKTSGSTRLVFSWT
jgi:isocitrate lyase